MQRPYKITKYHSRDKYNQQRWRYLCEKLQDERDKQKKGIEIVTAQLSGLHILCG